MKAAVLTKIGGPLEIQELEIPTLQHPRDVLVKIKSCGLCYTDIKLRDGKVAALAQGLPLILGHEPAGDIVAVGEDVTEFNIGDRVTAYNMNPCGRCEYCLISRGSLCNNLGEGVGLGPQGGFSEYTRIPAHLLVKIPDNVSYEDAAVAADAIVTPYHAIVSRAGVKIGDTVVIVGAGGGLGIHALQIARQSGAAVIAVDVSAEKLSLAQQQGALHVIDASQESFGDKVKCVTNGRGADHILEFVATKQTLQEDMKAVAKGGKIVLCGYKPGAEISFGDATKIVLEEIQIMGSHYASSKQELINVLNLIGAGFIKPVITRSYQLSEINKAIDDLEKGLIAGRSVINI